MLQCRGPRPAARPARLAAIAEHVARSTDLAAECADGRQRGWDGDEELADQLDMARGAGPATTLRPLPVDLEELAILLEGDEFGGGGRIDRHTGEVWSQGAIEYAEEVGEEDPDSAEDEHRWLWVDCEGSSDGYRDMQAFIATVTDPGHSDLQGRGAFRMRIQRHPRPHILDRWPGELDRWYAYSE